MSLESGEGISGLDVPRSSSLLLSSLSERYEATHLTIRTDGSFSPAMSNVVLRKLSRSSFFSKGSGPPTASDSFMAP